MIKEEISDLKKTLDNLVEEKKKVVEIVDLLFLCLKKNKKILICGNGGSAAEAEHLSAEFVVRLKPNNNRKALPLISLTQNSSVLTACGNDLGFEKIFSRSLESMGDKGDILLVLSTSGNSKNILHVLSTAKKKKIKSIALLGNSGGKAKSLSDVNITVPSMDVARVQECHLFLGHYILTQVEKKLLKNNVLLKL
jgi:D-sedoheptulose 7-phosphate isomerase